jgi:hypothetical protein
LHGKCVFLAGWESLSQLTSDSEVKSESDVGNG